VDVLRELVHNHSKYEQELVDIRMRLQDCVQQKQNLSEIIQIQRIQTLTSLHSETCTESQGEGMGDPLDLLDHSYSISQTNLLEETKSPVKVEKKKLSREGNVLSGPRESEHIYVNNCNYLHAKEESRSVQSSSVNKESVCDSENDQLCSNESDSGLDVTPEGTPFTSRPESELLINDEKPEDDVKASPRQLEMLMEDSNFPNPLDKEPTHEAVEELLRVLSDPNIAISVDEIEAIVSGRDESFSENHYVESSPKCVHDLGLIDEAEIQLFDPNDPKVRDLEEWNCSIHERSVIEEESTRRKLKRVFSFQKKVRKLEERKLVTKKYRTRGRYSNDESLTMECLKSWLLQIFVNVFD